MLASFYNVHNRTMNVSGPDDPSASMFRVTRFVWLLRFMVWLKPSGFRFVADESGKLSHVWNPAGVRSITNADANRLTLKPDFMTKVKDQWKPVTGFYFLKNYRIGVDNSI